MRMTLPLILAAGLVAGCQTTQGPDPDIRTGEGMVDPVTGTLLPEFNDGSFALSFVVEEKTGRSLSNSDRREIDAALDRAMGAPVAAEPALWSSPLSGHEGEVDVTDWRLDRRAGELCGIIRHAQRLEDRISGAVTICRASIDPAWRIDEVAWDEPRRTTRARPAQPAAPAVSTTTPGVTVIEKGGQTNPRSAVNYGPGETTQQPRQAPAPAPDCDVDANTGAQTLGDCLAPG